MLYREDVTAFDHEVTVLFVDEGRYTRFEGFLRKREAELTLYSKVASDDESMNKPNGPETATQYPSFIADFILCLTMSSGSAPSG